MIRTILADDHVKFRKSLANMLEKSGKVNLLAQAENGNEAFKLVRDHKPDVAILDITMPGRTGIEVAEKIMDAGLPTNVILLTTHDDSSLVVLGQKAGAAGHILKENVFEDLLIAVQTVNEGEKFVSSCMAKEVKELNKLTHQDF
ncbi:MAG: response regulator transcription factor [Magnetococcales bacterium]|nr:response regulator transcription factor [Magnetococcales bacterium]